MLGVLIGDALGVGCHWYYDFAKFRERYGEVTGFVDPFPGHYHEGLPRGAPSQTGEVMIQLLRSLEAQAMLRAAVGSDEHAASAIPLYNEADFTARLDGILAGIDGTPKGGRAGYTDRMMRDVYQSRVVRKEPWGGPTTASWTNTSEAAQRVPMLSAALCGDMHVMSEAIFSNVKLTYRDDFTVAESTAFGLAAGVLVANPGVSIDSLAFRAAYSPWVMGAKLRLFRPDVTLIGGDGDAAPGNGTLGTIHHFDSGVAPTSVGTALRAGLKIDPYLVNITYSWNCASEGVIRTGYMLAGMFPSSFEKAVLAAVNGAGNNMARAAATGALAGAQVGLSGIPKRFIDGLENGAELVRAAVLVANVAHGGR